MQQTLQPSITWLNMSGDVTITWDAANRERIVALVRQKMSQGYTFFIVKPRAIKLFGQKKVKLTDPAQLDGATGIVVPDEQVQALMDNLNDDDVGRAVRDGAAKLAKVSAGEAAHTPTRRARSAEEVVSNRTVAVRRVVGG